MPDSQNLSRLGQLLVVDFKRASGSPPKYSSAWQPVWDAKVDRVVNNIDGRSSEATIWFPTIRWDEDCGLYIGDMVRIRTDQSNNSNQTIIFIGFVTAYDMEFSGGMGQPGSSYERNAVVCRDHRWLMETTTAVTGQIARGPDDFDEDANVKPESFTVCTGRRAIFNENGKPNKSSIPVTKDSFDDTCIFCDDSMPGTAHWTASEMLWYLLSPIRTLSFQFLTIKNLQDLVGVYGHEDWNKQLNHIVVDGLNCLEAIQLLCKHLGWSFRLDFWPEEPEVEFVFFKNVGDVNSLATKKHSLYAPDVGDDLAAAVSRGEKLLWAASIVKDISPVINSPIALGAPHRFEFTAELVPAWRNQDLIPDVNNPFYTEAELAAMDDPDDSAFFRAYHSRGVQFHSDKNLRLVGRRWCLNESGSYSIDAYDRGRAFKWEEVLPDEYMNDSEGKLTYSWFRRKLLNCLTVRPDDRNSIGVVIEFSFDKGVTWEEIPNFSIRNLSDECGIYISEPNLSEIKPKVPSEISGGDLDGVELNYWTSLCDDFLAANPARDYKERFNLPPDLTKVWHTRVRVTASVQMDQRIQKRVMPSTNSGSPFDQTQIYDFSEKYGLAKRNALSVFGVLNHPVSESDDQVKCLEHITKIRDANEDISLSGRYTLERLWLGDGSGWPDFKVGDYIEKITGRNFELGVSFKGGTVYPQIVQIVYMPEKQKQMLVTRDLRFSEPTL